METEGYYIIYKAQSLEIQALCLFWQLDFTIHWNHKKGKPSVTSTRLPREHKIVSTQSSNLSIRHFLESVNRQEFLKNFLRIIALIGMCCLNLAVNGWRNNQYLDNLRAASVNYTPEFTLANKWIMPQGYELDCIREEHSE